VTILTRNAQSAGNLTLEGVGSSETIWEAPIVQLIVEDIVLSPVKACE